MPQPAAAPAGHYIPLRKRELIDLLASDGLAPEAEEALRRLAELLAATFHFEYLRPLEELKELYAPFDPDAVTKSVRPLAESEKAAQLEQLSARFSALLERANFVRLDQQSLAKAAEAASHLGVSMDVDFQVFDRLDVYVRGEAIGQYPQRIWWKPWIVETQRLPIYQRLVVLAKLRPSKRLPSSLKVGSVFIKLFKEIPKVDVEMLLPGARLRMPLLQRWKLGGSVVGGGAWVGYGALSQLLTTSLTLELLYGPLAAIAGYGYKQYFGYQSTRTAFNLRLTENLYFQTLGSNLGVFATLLDEAEEQECREALLAYTTLWRHAGPSGWRAADLDAYIELDLQRLAEVHVDFEVDDALQKLLRLGLVTRQEDRFAAVPIDHALKILDEQWDRYFLYANAPR